MAERDPDSVYCDTCGVEVTTGLMAVYCPRAEGCEFWPDDEASQAFIRQLRAQDDSTEVHREKA